MHGFSRLRKNFGDQTGAGGLAVSSGDGNDWDGVEPIRQLNFADDFDAPTTGVFKKWRMDIHSRT